MTTLVVVWFVGGLIAVIAYLFAVVRPTAREHVPTAGISVEVFHFVPRIAGLFILWPVAAVGLLALRLSERFRKGRAAS